ncbi:MAG: hypothetical protein NTV35_14950 [Chloroflexi bacterium]|nr:hypothetical protein [Chloroflexota bacterium]
MPFAGSFIGTSASGGLDALICVVIMGASTPDTCVRTFLGLKRRSFEGIQDSRVASYAVGRGLPVDAVCRSLSVSMVDAGPNGGTTVPR